MSSHVIYQLNQSHDVIRSPAQEKGGDNGSNDLKRSTWLAGKGAISSETMDYNSIAGDNDSEGDNKSQKEAGDGHGLMTKLSQLIYRWCFIIIRKGKVVEAVDDVIIVIWWPSVPEDEVWSAENQSQDPNA